MAPVGAKNLNVKRHCRQPLEVGDPYFYFIAPVGAPLETSTLLYTSSTQTAFVIVIPLPPRRYPPIDYPSTETQEEWQDYCSDHIHSGRSLAATILPVGTPQLCLGWTKSMEMGKRLVSQSSRTGERSVECPTCGYINAERSKRRWWEKIVTSVGISKRPYRCMSCWWRFWV